MRGSEEGGGRGREGEEVRREAAARRRAFSARIWEIEGGLEERGGGEEIAARSSESEES